jgi:hypothetical protein
MQVDLSDIHIAARLGCGLPLVYNAIAVPTARMITSTANDQQFLELFASKTLVLRASTVT